MSGNHSASRVATARNKGCLRIHVENHIRMRNVPVREYTTVTSGIPVRMFTRILGPSGVGKITSGRCEALVADQKTVLLVEDNEDNRIIYATALRFAGYSVLEAVTGPEGVRHAREDLPDLILMDISIPELDGWEATALLKADPATRHIPIVAVTAHALPEDERRSVAAGCDGYLAKPIAPARLIAEVDRRFGRTNPSYNPPTPSDMTLGA